METKKDYNSPNVRLVFFYEDDVVRTSPGATTTFTDDGENANGWLGAWN